MTALAEYLCDRARDGVIDLAAAVEAAEVFALTLAKVETQALLLDLMPLRYLRNGISCAEQLRLQHARIGVIGCGGLGGTVAELLARLGIGRLRLVDPDFFEEHNLNRQRFATVDSLGQAKVEAARRALVAINPGICIDAVCAAFHEDDIAAVDVVVDGLDSPLLRLRLAELCTRLHRPLVHGAVRKWYGQAGVQTSRNDLLALLYPNISNTAGKTAAEVLAPTVAAVAAIQAAETVKLILGHPSPLTNHWLSINLRDGDFSLLGE